MKYAFFALLNTTPAWLQLTRKERSTVSSNAFKHALPDQQVGIQHFDAEAFSGRCTDIVLFETENITSYYFTLERLRDSPLFTVPYFEIVDIVPAIEDGFRIFEANEGVAL